MNKFMRITFGVAALALAASAMAQVTPDPAPDRFDAADTNHDGKVDRAEYDGFVAELVLLYDTDRDGKLSRAEVATARDPSKFDVIDANHDESLVFGEVAAFSDNDFKVMDANGDGVIDREESKHGK